MGNCFSDVKLQQHHVLVPAYLAMVEIVIGKRDLEWVSAEHFFLLPPPPHPLELTLGHCFKLKEKQ